MKFWIGIAGLCLFWGASTYLVLYYPTPPWHSAAAPEPTPIPPLQDATCALGYRPTFLVQGATDVTVLGNALAFNRNGRFYVYFTQAGEFCSVIPAVGPPIQGLRPDHFDSRPNKPPARKINTKE